MRVRVKVEARGRLSTKRRGCRQAAAHPPLPKEIRRESEDEVTLCSSSSSSSPPRSSSMSTCGGAAQKKRCSEPATRTPTPISVAVGHDRSASATYTSRALPPTLTEATTRSLQAPIPGNPPHRSSLRLVDDQRRQKLGSGQEGRWRCSGRGPLVLVTGRVAHDCPSAGSRGQLLLANRQNGKLVFLPIAVECTKYDRTISIDAERAFPERCPASFRAFHPAANR